MKIISLLYLALFFLSFSSIQAQDKEAMVQDLRVDVIYLASDYLEGRETGTRGEALAAQYIATRFEEAGCIPKGDDDSWFHHFDFKYNPNPHGNAAEAEERTGKNVVGFLDKGAKTTIVIGAHYDHLGMGEFGSRHTGEPAIHNGADDNASGVAGMILLAEYLNQSKFNNNNYLFIAFSGEELGLYGSKNYVKRPSLELEKINYLINMDMIGRLNEEKVLSVNGVGTSPAFMPFIENIKVADINAKTRESGIGPSDHTSFYTKGIPVLHFFTGQHMDYHKPEDDSYLVNYQGIYEVSSFIIEIIKGLDDKGELAFTKTKDDSEDKKVSNFKVTLGVMPDYVHNGEGMRIDAVLDGRPAQKAGLEDGDIVIKMGDMKIKDIYAYMEGLSKHKKGDKVKVTVLRGKKKVTKTVEF